MEFRSSNRLERLVLRSGEEERLIDVLHQAVVTRNGESLGNSVNEKQIDRGEHELQEGKRECFGHEPNE